MKPWNQSAVRWEGNQRPRLILGQGAENNAVTPHCFQSVKRKRWQSFRGCLQMLLRWYFLTSSRREKGFKTFYFTLTCRSLSEARWKCFNHLCYCKCNYAYLSVHILMAFNQFKSFDILSLLAMTTNESKLSHILEKKRWNSSPGWSVFSP